MLLAHRQLQGQAMGAGTGGAGWASAHPGKNQGGHGPPWKFKVLKARDRSACCVGWKRGFDAQQASLGWITSSFLWHILQDQFTWTAWLKISFALTTSARMTLDC